MTATSRGSSGRPSYVAPEVEQPHDVAGHVDVHVLADRGHPQGPAGPDAERLVTDHPQPQRRAGADEAAARGGGRARRAPRSRRRPARRRAAPRAASRAAPRRSGGWWPASCGWSRWRRPEVGRDVAAAEGVDRLLRVADQHHRRVAGERPVEHLPLHRVGVLELVDEHHLPALPHPLAGRRGVVGQRVGELGEQVVVARARRAGACGGRAPRGPRSRTPTRTPGSGGRVELVEVGLQPGLRVLGRGPRQPQRVRVAEQRLAVDVAEAAQVEVVDHLGQQVVQVLDEPGAGVGVAGDAEAAEHEVAELVRGGDGGAVEGAQRVAQPLPPLPALVVGWRRGAAPPGRSARATAGRVGERALGLDQLGRAPARGAPGSPRART